MEKLALTGLYALIFVGVGLLYVIAGLVFLFLVLAMPFGWVWMRYRKWQMSGYSAGWVQGPLNAIRKALRTFRSG
jgi:hypothetical protein